MDVMISIPWLAQFNRTKMLNLCIIAASILLVILAHPLMGLLAPWFADIHGVHSIFLAAVSTNLDNATVGGGGPW